MQGIMRRKHQLASLQLAIMQALWDRGEATVADVREALTPARRLAYTTVATMLTKLERHGQVAHRTDGRVNIYRPLIRRDEVERSMVSDLASRLFSGDLEEMVSHLLDARDVTPEELARLKSLIRKKERAVRDGR